MSSQIHMLPWKKQECEAISYNLWRLEFYGVVSVKKCSADGKTDVTTPTRLERVKVAVEWKGGAAAPGRGQIRVEFSKVS
jgi:hypothetical protein